MEKQNLEKEKILRVGFVLLVRHGKQEARGIKMLKTILNMINKTEKMLTISEEQQKELNEIENKAYMEAMRKYSKDKGEMLAKKKFERFTATLKQNTEVKKWIQH